MLAMLTKETSLHQFIRFYTNPYFNLLKFYCAISLSTEIDFSHFER